MLARSPPVRAGHAAERGPIATMSEGDHDDDDWTNEVYHAQAEVSSGAPRRHAPRAAAPRRWPFSRVFVLAFSLMLSFCGAVIISVCLSPTRLEALVTICTSCHYFMSVGVSFGAGILFMGLVAALVTSSTRCWNRAFPTVLVSVVFVAGAVACFAVAITALVLRLNHLSTPASMRQLWSRAVVRHAALVCDVETSLECSGFAPGKCCVAAPYPLVESRPHRRGSPAPCFYVDANGTTFDPSTLSVIDWPSTDCPALCAANEQYNRACYSPLESLFSRTFTSLCLVFFVIGTTFCLFAYTTWQHHTDARRDLVEEEEEHVRQPLLAQEE